MTARHTPHFSLTSSRDGLAETLAQVEVSEVHGNEQISQLYHYRVHLVARAGIPHSDLLNAPITLVATRAQDNGKDHKVERHIGGIVASARDRMITEASNEQYVLDVVPAFWVTSLTCATDVFQEMTVPEIIENILKDIYRWTAGKEYELRLKGSYPKRDFVVQYNETHLNFISRICENAGIFFFFEYSESIGQDLVVFGDDNAHFKPASPDTVLFARRGEKMHLYELEVTVQQRTRQYRVRDYNYRTPHIEMAADQQFEQGAWGVLDEYGGDFRTRADAVGIAKIRSEESAMDFLSYQARSDYPGLRAGSTVSVEGHPADAVTSTQLLVTQVTHDAVQSVGGSEHHYESTAYAISAKTPYRPPRTAYQPRVSGLVTAMVESPQKDAEKYGAMDDSGRYRLNFHHDSRLNLGGNKEREPAKASLPVRMAQPSAGADRNFHLPLKHGTEVVVACINGDPDRPVIVGAVPDLGGDKGWRGSPVTETNKEKLIVRTNLSELSIDDTEGKPRWRTQVGHAAHVHLLGEPEQDKLSQTRIPEKGHALASVDNLTATVNKQLTFESTDYTALQQMQTVLTATKAVDFTGEDPGWEDWKGFEQALAKAVSYTRLLEELAVKKKEAQTAKANKRAQKATIAHKQTQKQTISTLNQERAQAGEAPLQHDPNSGKPEEQWRDGAVSDARTRNETARKDSAAKSAAVCAQEAQAQKEYDALEAKKTNCQQRMRDASAQQRQAENKLRGAQRQQAKAKSKMGTARASHADRAAGQSELAAASADEQAARAQVDEAQAEYAKAKGDMPSPAELRQKKLAVAEARQRCKQAREEEKREKRKKAALDKEKKAAKKRDKAQAAARRKLEFWAAIDVKTQAGKATELTELEKTKAPEPGEEKDLWSKIAKELSDKTHKAQLDETKAALDEAKSSLAASSERDDADAGSFQEPYAIRVAKDSIGVLGGSNAFFYGDSFATMYSPKNAQLVSGDRAHVKAETGVEIATDDWIKITSSKVIDVQCDTDIKLVADSAEDKAMPGGHSMLFYSNKGINMESATGMIEAKAMKSIEMTADMQGIKMTANLANIELTASAGQLKAMGMAGIMFNTPATITLAAAGAQSHTAAGAITVSAGGAYTAAAAGAATMTAGGAVTIAAGAAATLGAAGLVTIAGSGLLLL